MAAECAFIGNFAGEQFARREREGATSSAYSPYAARNARPQRGVLVVARITFSEFLMPPASNFAGELREESVLTESHRINLLLVTPSNWVFPNLCRFHCSPITMELRLSGLIVIYDVRLIAVFKQLG